MEAKWKPIFQLSGLLFDLEFIHLYSATLAYKGPCRHRENMTPQKRAQPGIELEASLLWSD